MVTPRKITIIAVVLAIAFAASTAPGQYTPPRRSSSTLSQGRSLDEKANRPNIVLFCADALGFSDLGCYGGEIVTPNLDKMAAEGLRMTQFYNAGQSVPSRASLLTGHYAHRTGIGYRLEDFKLPAYNGNIYPQTPVLAEILREHGYQSIMTGRWALSRYMGGNGPKYNWPNNRGFDWFYGTLTYSGNQFNPLALMLNLLPTTPYKGNYYLTEATAVMTEHFLDEAARINKPIFLYVSLPAPLWPLQAPEGDIKSYKGKYLRGWDDVRQSRYDSLKAKYLINSTTQLTPRDANVVPWNAVGAFGPWQMSRMEVYAAEVTSMDRTVGMVIDKMAKIGRDNNTIYIFVSASGAAAEEIDENFNDPKYMSPTTRTKIPVLVGNSPKIQPGGERTFQSYGIPWANVSNTPFRGYAGQTYEGAIASPCIVQFNDRIRAPGRITHQPVHIIDIVPTILEIIEQDYPETVGGIKTAPITGVSFASLFEQKNFTRSELYWEYEGNLAIRQGKWKLVSDRPEGDEAGRTWQLFDLDTDRSEMNNLVEQYPSVARALFSSYNEWARTNGVKPWSTVVEAYLKVQENKERARGLKQRK